MVSLTIFKTVNSVTEIITVGGIPSQTFIDSLDYILGVKSILFSPFELLWARAGRADGNCQVGQILCMCQDLDPVADVCGELDSFVCICVTWLN